MLQMMVRAKRLELIRLAALEPKSSASANSATPAKTGVPGSLTFALRATDPGERIGTASQRLKIIHDVARAVKRKTRFISIFFHSPLIDIFRGGDYTMNNRMRSPMVRIRCTT